MRVASRPSARRGFEAALRRLLQVPRGWTPWALLVLIACGCGKSYWLGQYQAQVEKGTALIAKAKTDHERAEGYTQRARGYGEQARYLRAFQQVTLTEYVALFDRAMQDHDAAQKLDPSSAAVYVGRALTAFDRGFPAPPDTLEPEAKARELRQLAAADFSKAIDIEARNEVALDRRGMIREATPDFDGASRDYTVLMDVNARLGKSRLADLHCRRGQERATATQYDLAAADYERAIAFDAPADACACEPYGAAASTYFEAGRYDQAWDAVHRAKAKHRWVPDEMVAALAKASGRDR